MWTQSRASRLVCTPWHSISPVSAMVKFALQLRASLDNVARLQPGEEFSWELRLQCTKCGERSGWREVGGEERRRGRTPLGGAAGGRGTPPLRRYSALVRCKVVLSVGWRMSRPVQLCCSEGSVDILDQTVASLTQADSGQFTTIVVFHCREVEPVDFSAGPGWKVE